MSEDKDKTAWSGGAGRRKPDSRAAGPKVQTSEEKEPKVLHNTRMPESKYQRIKNVVASPLDFSSANDFINKAIDALLAQEEPLAEEMRERFLDLMKNKK